MTRDPLVVALLTVLIVTAGYVVATTILTAGALADLILYGRIPR